MFRSVIVSLLALASAVLCSAQAVAPVTSNAPKYSLSGVVVNSVTGEPLRRALVEIYASEPQALLTESDGHFSFSDLPQGNYIVQVRKPGFFREEEVSREFRGMNVSVGPDSKPVILKLMPEAVIVGTVTDQDGLPVPRLAVRVVRREVIEGRARWGLGHQMVGTDEQGQYRVGGLAPGTYAVAAGPTRQPVDELRGRKGALLGYRLTYFPNAPDLASAAAIQARPGQKVEANFSLAPEQFFSVKGTVIGGTGNVNLLLFQDQNSRVPLGRVDQATGAFESKFVAPGRYVLYAISGEQGGQTLTATFPLAVNRDILDVRVAMQPSVSIPIEVEERHVSTRHSEQGTAMIGKKRVPGVSVALIPTDDIQRSTGGVSYRPEGLALNGVPPGTYMVRVDPQFPWYVESVTRGGVDLMSEGLTVSSSAAQAPIEVVLRDDGATLKTTLKNNSTGVGGALLVIPDQQRSAVRQYGIGAQVSFIPPFKPGSYTLLAFDEVSSLEYSKPEVLEPYLSRGLHVTLNADEETTVSLELIRRRQD